jgi:hypothetical protein
MVGPAVSDDGSITAARFEQEVRQVLTEDHPELRGKSRVRVVDTHGAAHSWLYHRVRAAGVNVKRTFSEMPYVYPHSTENIRKLTMGKELTRLDLVKYFAENLIVRAIDRSTREQVSTMSPTVVRYIRSLVETFNEADARAMFDRLKNKGNGARSVLVTVNKMLKQKGLAPLATSLDQIHKYHEKQKEEFERKKIRVQAESDARRAAGQRTRERQNRL